MASQQIENEIQKNLKKIGFARINGELHKKKKNKINYNITASKDTPYSIDVSNIHTGENLKLKIKGQNGNVIAKATDSHGSKNPHLTFNVEKKQNVKVIIQVEDDKNNKGKIPFKIAFNKFNKISGGKLNASDKNDSNNKNNSKSSSESKELSSTVNSVTKLWDQVSASSDDINIKDLDDLVGATTSDGSTVSQDEINALSQIQDDLKDYVDSDNLDYYSYIFGAAIGSNPANANYTGGVKSDSDIQELGNLSVGFTSEQVTLLQQKWFKGEDLPLAQVEGDAAAGIAPSTFDYAMASGDLFDGSPSFKQLSQGDAGTCWFLSSLNAVANASSTSSNITDMFIDNKDGTYGVRFYGPQGSEEAWVTVNKALPITNYFDDSLMMAGSKTSGKLYENYYVKPRVNLRSSGYGPANLTWAALAEKALAQVNETDILRRSSDQNSYEAIEGGLSLGIDYLTGQQNYNSYIYTIPFSDFESINPTVDPILLGSSTKWSGSPDGTTQLVSGHAYSIVDKTYDDTTETYNFIVANPWGETAFNYDSTFTIPGSELESLYNNKSIFLTSTIQ